MIARGALLALVGAFPVWASAGQAQRVPIAEDTGMQPQIQIDGVSVATLGYARDSERGRARIDLSDSALTVGAAERLHEGGAIGSLGFGGVTVDDTNRGTGSSFFMHQAFVDVQCERFEALVGRSDNPTAHLVDFPTLRGDDLIGVLNPLDPYSNGANAEEHRYANVAQITLNQGLRYFASVHAQHLIDSAGIGTDTGINSFGATLEYRGAPGLEAFERVPTAGIGYEHLTLDARSPGGLHQLYGGGAINLTRSMTDRWEARVQDILSVGSDRDSLMSATDAFQADSNAIAASLRYLHSPFGQSGYQVALTGGAKTYFKVADARSASWALTGVRQLGRGFDVVAQYKGEWRAAALAAAMSAGHAYEQVAEVGFVYSFSATLNPHLSPRRTILNQRHQYVPS